VAFGELLVGIALIVGIFTHIAALMGVLMNLAFLLAESTSTNPQLLMIALVGGVTVGYYGLDYFARSKASSSEPPGSASSRATTCIAAHQH
jgi:thiosulfate dehydrogenase (quinone) large subunit